MLHLTAAHALHQDYTVRIDKLFLNLTAFLGKSSQTGGLVKFG